MCFLGYGWAASQLGSNEEYQKFDKITSARVVLCKAIKSVTIFFSFPWLSINLFIYPPWPDAVHLSNAYCFYVISAQINVQTDKKSAQPSLPSKVLKNKSLLCKPLVQNKGVSCKTQTVDCEAQTGKSNTCLPLTLVVLTALLICGNKEQTKLQNYFYPPIL